MCRIGCLDGGTRVYERFHQMVGGKLKSGSNLVVHLNSRKRAAGWLQPDMESRGCCVGCVSGVIPRVWPYSLHQ